MADLAAAGSQLERASERRGVLAGLVAYSWWGFIPLYFKAVDHIPAMELVAHRTFWSMALLVVVLWWRGTLRATPRLLGDLRLAGALLVSAVLLATNWLTFIIAVESDRVVEASLGYFINPLVNVLLGCVFLRERLTRPQWASISLAGIGVTVLAAATGVVPWIALILSFSFGFYGLVRKVVSVGPIQGHGIEMALLAPFGLGYLVWLGARGDGAFLGGSLADNLLLPAIALVSVAPLLCFIDAARRLRYATIGFMQYIAPSLQFLLAVLAFGEPFGRPRMAGFVFIWAGLALYSWDAVRRSRRRPAVTAASAPAGSA